MLFDATWWFVWLFDSNKIPYTETPNMHSISFISYTVYYIQYNPPSILKSVYYSHNMHWPFDFHIPLSTETKAMLRSKRFLSEPSPSVGRRLIKFQSSNQINSFSNQICPVRLGRNPFSSQTCPFQSAAWRKLSQVLSRQLHRSHRKSISVPWEFSDRIFMSRQAGDHPCSGRRDNSFMQRRPYAEVAPA
jgi:hypothetical protein